MNAAGRDPELDRELALFEQKLKNNGGGKRAGLVGPARSTPTRRDPCESGCRFCCGPPAGSRRRTMMGPRIAR